MERVRWWWGILGSISDATGHIDTRVLFRTTRRRETSVWRDEPAAASTGDRAECAR